MPVTYPAKLLLFGEHTVLRGSRGLVVPYLHYALRWTQGAADERLLSFADFLSTCGPAPLPLELDVLRRELQGGARLTGNIPTGYGLGSSGAVCAALFDRYATPRARALPLPELRALLARMEGFFHGSSSGTDPLSCYLQRPLLLSGGAAGERTYGVGAPQVLALPEGWQAGWFLLDTGRSRSASPLIERFLKDYTDHPERVRNGWIAPTERAIDALLAGERIALQEAFAAISDYQLQYAHYLIPEAYRQVWSRAGTYHLKVCGAGGGGMLLGLAQNAERTEAIFGSHLQWLLPAKIVPRKS